MGMKSIIVALLAVMASLVALFAVTAQSPDPDPRIVLNVGEYGSNAVGEAICDEFEFTDFSSPPIKNPRSGYFPFNGLRINEDKIEGVPQWAGEIEIEVNGRCEGVSKSHHKVEIEMKGDRSFDEMVLTAVSQSAALCEHNPILGCYDTANDDPTPSPAQ